MRNSVFSIILVIFTAFSGIACADETFVGILAIALEDGVAEEIGLGGQVRSELEDFVNDREGEALELALSLRDLSPEAQQKQLDAFRQASEEQGLQLLDAGIRQALENVKLRREGLSALGREDVAERFGLTDEQQARIEALLAERDAKIATVGSSKAKLIRRDYDRQLKLVLGTEQTAAWRTAIEPKGDAASIQGLKSRDGWQGQGGSAEESMPLSAAAEKGSGRLQFSFRYAPWRNVIEWFAEQCDLSLLMDAPPQGTFNYSDPRSYSQAQAIDLLNSVLLTKGYTLIRREKMLQVINLEDGIPPNLVPEVREEQLGDLGDYELVRCVFTLRNVDASLAQEEIERLLGPQGAVKVLTSSNQLAITETAGRLRTFQRILEQGERKNTSALGQAQLLSLDYVRASKIIATWRRLMGLSEEENATADGTLRVTQGKTSRELIVSGRPNAIGDFQELVKALDVAPSGGPRDIPQLEVYSVDEADPESVLSVLDTLLEGIDDVRLANDPKSRSIVALARPDDQETIRATIDQLQADRRIVEVVRLRAIDPQLAMLSIEKLFPSTAGDEEGMVDTAPIVDADPVTRSLMIRGSQSQIDDIKTLLTKMGEDESGDGRSGIAGGGGKLRLIPVDAATARRAMEQINTIWPTMRKNRIRTVTPSSRVRGVRTSPGPGSSPLSPVDERIRHSVPTRDGKASSSSLESSRTPSGRVDEADTVLRVGTSTLPVAQNLAGASAQDTTNVPATDTSEGDERLPEVLITFGEQGLLIASEDMEALDEFEQLFLAVSDRMFAGTRELSVFYLRYVKADVAAEFVRQFVGGASSGSSGGGGTLLGNLAGAALGGSGSGIIGTLLGAGGSSSSVSLSKGTSVIADPRLNALVVQATPKELDFIDDLLQVLDRANSPSVIETVPRPRAIPVIHANADDIAEIVRSVYASRLSGGSQTGQMRPPSPEEFLKAISGQKNTGKEIAAAIGDQVGVSISVDARRNALIVIAPESLFVEIEDLVGELDFPLPERRETVRYGTVGNASPDMIRNLVATLMDEESSQPAVEAKKRSGSNAVATPTPRGPNMEDMKRRMEFLRAMQKMSGQNQAAAKKRNSAKPKSGEKK